MEQTSHNDDSFLSHPADKVRFFDRCFVLTNCCLQPQTAHLAVAHSVCRREPSAPERRSRGRNAHAPDLDVLTASRPFGTEQMKVCYSGFVPVGVRTVQRITQI